MHVLQMATVAGEQQPSDRRIRFVPVHRRHMCRGFNVRSIHAGHWLLSDAAVGRGTLLSCRPRFKPRGMKRN